MKTREEIMDYIESLNFNVYNRKLSDGIYIHSTLTSYAIGHLEALLFVLKDDNKDDDFVTCLEKFISSNCR